MPEDVNQALSDALTRMQWSQDASTYRTIFWSAMHPPMKIMDGLQWPDLCAKLAKSQGIKLNTVLAEMMAQPLPIPANRPLAGGDHPTIGQNVATLTATLFDDQIAKLSSEMDDTRVFWDVAERKAL